MKLLEQLINFLAAGAILLTVLTAYLVANKLWSRKHEKVVSESISVSAQLIGIVTMLPFLAKYILFDSDYMSFTGMTIRLALTLFFLAIGIGFWVSPDGSAVEVNYYSSPAAPMDSYAQLCDFVGAVGAGEVTKVTLDGEQVRFESSDGQSYVAIKPQDAEITGLLTDANIPFRAEQQEQSGWAEDWHRLHQQIQLPQLLHHN